jgi:site-specific DNA-methyltransferase (adenine-specific)
MDESPTIAESVAPEGVFCADSLEMLARVPDGSLDLVYIDPPFRTGKTQRLNSRAGSQIISSHQYRDDMPLPQYLEWLERNLREIHRALRDTGSLYLHLDWHVAAHARLLCDQIFGPERFLNEIIWAYDFGGRARDRWAAKHDNILWYAKGPTHTFNRDTIKRIPYMAPGLVGPEKAARGKLPTDVFWITIVPTAGLDRTGWPTQKPRALLERIISASSSRGELVADFFSGSGTTAAVAASLGRRYLVSDRDQAAVAITTRRLEGDRAGTTFRPSKAKAKSS